MINLQRALAIRAPQHCPFVLVNVHLIRDRGLGLKARTCRLGLELGLKVKVILSLILSSLLSSSRPTHPDDDYYLGAAPRALCVPPHGLYTVVTGVVCGIKPYDIIGGCSYLILPHSGDLIEVVDISSR